MNGQKLRYLGSIVLASTAAVLAGCTDARQERLEGAQRALAALPDAEIVASDAARGTLTVRSRGTGAIVTIDLAADGRGAAPAPETAAAASGDPAPDPATAGAAAAAPDEQAGQAAATDASGPTPGDGAGLASAGTAAAPAGIPAEAAAADAPIAATATVVRDPQGRVQRIEGSGFSIERVPAAARPATSGAGPAATAGPAPAQGGAVRRLSVPFVCGAGETRTLQGVELDVPGAGIVAERGCTLTVANVRVRSGGWGLVVNPGASVRIDDSLVEGRTGALDLHPGASLSAWATTFRGALGRPLGTPQFIDRGGNRFD